MAMTRTSKTLIATAAVIAGVLVFALVLTHATLYSAEPEIAPPPAVAAAAVLAATTTSALPASISIPAIGVDASVEDLGITTGDHMAMPTSFTTVGWYKYGPVPGAVGTAVMYGHLDNGLGLQGVFKKLGQLAPGDKIMVTNASGVSQTFVVNSLSTYPYQSVPASALESAPGDTGAHLNLITCAGGWIYDPVEGMTYDHRLVVYTTLMPS
jgi:sortase (surface protein transpeptidase)